jgi:hypothetical protein
MTHGLNRITTTHAERLCRYANLVGRDNVMAGTD